MDWTQPSCKIIPINNLIVQIPRRRLYPASCAAAILAHAFSSQLYWFQLHHIIAVRMAMRLCDGKDGGLCTIRRVCSNINKRQSQYRERGAPWRACEPSDSTWQDKTKLSLSEPIQFPMFCCFVNAMPLCIVCCDEYTMCEVLMKWQRGRERGNEWVRVGLCRVNIARYSAFDKHKVQSVQQRVNEWVPVLLDDVALTTVCLVEAQLKRYNMFDWEFPRQPDEYLWL